MPHFLSAFRRATNKRWSARGFEILALHFPSWSSLFSRINNSKLNLITVSNFSRNLDEGSNCTLQAWWTKFVRVEGEARSEPKARYFSLARLVNYPAQKYRQDYFRCLLTVMLTFRKLSSRLCIFLAQTQRPQSNTSSLVLDLFEKFEKTSQIVTNMEWENKTITDEHVTITTPVLLARLLGAHQKRPWRNKGISRATQSQDFVLNNDDRIHLI